MGKREQGTVVFYDSLRKFGFTADDWPGSPDHFFHLNEFPEGIPPVVGQRVTFVAEPSQNKPGKTHAIDIEVDEHQPLAEREAGTVKQFGHSYGFIARDVARDRVAGDLFVHKTSCVHEPVAGERVTFRVRPGRDGRMVAYDVQQETTP